MKNIFYILLLLPTIIFAQYPSNSGQKITLGEQTTADGLVYRGLASIDTVTATSKITRANKQDTSAYILLDTVTNLLWHYKTASNGWIQAGGSVTSVAALTLGTTGNDLSSSVATGTTTPVITLNVPDASESARGVISTGEQTITGNKTFRSLKIKNTGNYAYFDIANSNANFGGGLIRALQDNKVSGGFGVQGAFFGDTSKNLVFFSETDLDLIFATVSSTNYQATTRMTIRPLGNVGIGTTSPSEKLHVDGNGLFTGNLGVGGATPTTSGTGITFPATQSASTNANTLDDYEEGTWTPAIKYNTTNTPIHSNQTGRYTKIGSLVQITFILSFNENGSSGSYIVIEGLPYTVKDTNGAKAVVAMQSFGLINLPLNISLTGKLDKNTKNIELQLNDNSGTFITNLYTDNDQDIYGFVVYEAN